MELCARGGSSSLESLSDEESDEEVSSESESSSESEVLSSELSDESSEDSELVELVDGARFRLFPTASEVQ